MINSFNLLAALQDFLRERNINAERLTVEPMIRAMLDWFRLERLALVKDASAAGRRAVLQASN